MSDDLQRQHDKLIEERLHAERKTGAAPSELAAPAGSVFEVVDATSEESYYTMGIWPTLEAAVKALRNLGPDAPGEHDDDCCVVEIRKRKIGVLDWSESGKLVWKFVWEKKYDASDDSYVWRVSDTPNAAAVRRQTGTAAG